MRGQPLFLFALKGMEEKTPVPSESGGGVSGGNWFHPEEPGAKRYTFPAGNVRLVTPLSFCPSARRDAFPFHFARNSGTIRRVMNEEVSL